MQDEKIGGWDKLAITLGAMLVGSAMVLGTMLLGATLFAFPLKWTWNYVAVPMFHAPEVDVFQAWCLLFLANNLIKPNLICKCKTKMETAAEFAGRSC